MYPSYGADRGEPVESPWRLDNLVVGVVVVVGGMKDGLYKADWMDVIISPENCCFSVDIMASI